MADKSLGDDTMTRKPTFGQKLKAHLRKWWWVHLIIFCISFLIIALCLTYVAFPNIAQDDVNEAELEIESQRLTEATPDSVRLKIDTISNSESLFHPTLDAFNATLSVPVPEGEDGESIPFGTIEIPQNVAGEDVHIAIDQVMRIENMEEWMRFNKMVLHEEEFEIQVSGDVKLHLGALPEVDCDYDKIVRMKGLNQLKGFKITDNKVELKNGGKADISGNVHLPNPSVLTLELGQVTLDLSIDGTHIGQAVMEDVVLPPGGGVFPMTGETEQDKVLGMSSKYEDLVFPIESVGNKSVVNGVEVPWLTELLASNVLRFDFDLGKALGDGH